MNCLKNQIWNIIMNYFETENSYMILALELFYCQTSKMQTKKMFQNTQESKIYQQYFMKVLEKT